MTNIVEHLDHFQHRVIQDALSEGTAAYWRRRAETFRNARPTLGEFHGNLTAEQLRAKWLELTEIADACDARAELALMGDEAIPEIDAVLREVA